MFVKPFMKHMLTYDITLFLPELPKRAFLTISINGNRYREYNGNKINISIQPNKAKSLKDRNKLFKQLEFEFRKKIEDGSYLKLVSQSTSDVNTTEDLMKKALRQKLASNLNPHYASCLEKNCKNFLAFLTDKEKKANINLLDANRIQEYLDTYRTSPNNYMAKRREFGSLIGYIKNKGLLKHDVMRQTDRLKVKATLHKIYSQDQLKEVLTYLKENHENLYLCCLLSYGCLLRPHIEIRNLKGHHFKADCTEIHLSGNENKSGRIRTVLIPEYVRKAIYKRASALERNENLFSNSIEPFNEYYFKTAWSRHSKHLLQLGIIEEEQTIYSFRHTSAVNVYKKTKDLHILQQLLGHSDMIVTLKYLRGLGVHNMNELKHVMPEL